jgi:hypothetical protein
VLRQPGQVRWPHLWRLGSAPHDLLTAPLENAMDGTFQRTTGVRPDFQYQHRPVGRARCDLRSNALERTAASGSAALTSPLSSDQKPPVADDESVCVCGPMRLSQPIRHPEKWRESRHSARKLPTLRNGFGFYHCTH